MNQTPFVYEALSGSGLGQEHGKHGLGELIIFA